jgi:hypothetical protein
MLFDNNEYAKGYALLLRPTCPHISTSQIICDKDYDGLHLKFILGGGGGSSRIQHIHVKKRENIIFFQ